MLAVDTSIWIEIAVGSDLGARAKAALPTLEECAVPTIVQFELITWLTREVGVEAADAMMALTLQCVVVDFDSRIAALAADLSRQHRLATADAIVYATAQAKEATLLTADAHFKDLPGVTYFAKTTP